MPSTPQILSDATTTFNAYPELATKVDESPVADGDIDEYAGAAYPNFVDTCLADVNAAAKGEANWTNSGISARFADAPDSGWQGNAKDIVVGNGSLSRGISLNIPNTGAGSFLIRTPGKALSAGMSYGAAAKALTFYVDGSAEIVVDNASVRPHVTEGSQLGTPTHQFKRLELKGNAVLNSAPGGSAYVLFQDDGSSAFALFKHTDNSLRLGNYLGASGEFPLQLPSGGGIILGDSGGDVGFYGTTPQSKPTITGARDDGTALANLLSALEAMGLIVDSTTAS